MFRPVDAALFDFGIVELVEKNDVIPRLRMATGKS